MPEKTYQITIHCYKPHYSSNDFLLSEKEYCKFLIGYNPIKTTNGNTIYLDKNHLIHRDDNEVAYDGKTKKGENVRLYFLHGKFHRTDGPALFRENEVGYFLNGNRLLKEDYDKFFASRRKTNYFSPQKILTLRKLIEIPELFQEVYYENKKKLLSLLERI